MKIILACKIKKKYRYRFQVRNFLRKIGLDVSCIPCSALNFSKRKKITIFRFCLFCIHPYVITSFILNSNGCISQVVSLCLTKLKPGWEKNLCGYIISPLIPLFFFFFWILKKILNFSDKICLRMWQNSSRRRLMALPTHDDTVTYNYHFRKVLSKPMPGHTVFLIHFARVYLRAHIGWSSWTTVIIVVPCLEDNKK